MKWFLRILAVLVVLILVAVTSLSLYLTDERLKGMVMPPLQEALGDGVRVDRLGYTFFRTFPNLGLVVEGLTVPGPTGDTLVNLTSLRVSVPIMPLLSGDVQVTRILADTPNLTYIVYEDGTTNIDFLFAEEEEVAADTTASSDIRLDEIQVMNGRIRYEDRQGGMSADIEGLDLTASISLGNLINSDVNASASGVTFAMDGSTYLNRMPITIRQKSSLDMASETLSLTEGFVSIRGLALNTTGSISAWSGDSMAYRFEFASASDNFGALLDLVPEEFADEVDGIETRGALVLKGTVAGDVSMEVPDFDLVLAVTDGFLKHPSAAKPIEDIQVNMTATNARITIPSFKARAEQNTVNVTGSVDRPLEPTAEFALDAVVKADLGTLETYYPISDFGIALKGLLDLDAKANGRVDAPDQAVFNANLTLKDGWLKYTDVEKPIENIQMVVTSTQELLTIQSISANAAANTVSLTGTVRQPLDMDKARFDISAAANMNLETLKEFYPIDEDTLTLRGQMQFNAKANGLVSKPESAVAIGDLQLANGSIQYHSITDTMRVSGGIRADVRFNGTMDRLADMRFNGGMNVTSFSVSSPALDQPVTNMNGDLIFSDANVELKSFVFQMGSSDFTITGSAVQYKNLFEAVGSASPMRLNAQYVSRFLNVDEIYDINDTNDDPLYMELPNLSSTLTARIDSLVFVGMSITDIQGKANTTPKMLEMNEASALAFGGSMSGYMKWDIPQPDYTWVTFRGDLTNVRSEQFFKEFQLGGQSDFHKYISGGLTAKANFVTAMDEMLVQDAKTIQADGSFGMDRARIKDHPSQVRIADLLGLAELKDVSLDAWTATFAIKDGLMTLRDMNLTSKDIGLNLNGTHNLVTDRIDYKVHITLPGSYGNRLEGILTKDGVEALKNDKGMIVVPMGITGTSTDPSVGLDRDFLQNAIREYLIKKGSDAANRLFQGIIRN